MISSFNGVYIIKTLESLECPATMTTIQRIIADDLDVRVAEVKDWVKEALEGGFRYGYIQRLGQRYYLSSQDAEMKLTIACFEDGKRIVRILVYRSDICKDNEISDDGSESEEEDKEDVKMEESSSSSEDDDDKCSQT